MNNITATLAALSRALFRPVDATVLALFRFGFGAILLWEVTRYFYLGKIERGFVRRHFYFTYEYFDFVRPWPDGWIHLHFAVIGIAALCIAVGLFYRVAAIVFFLGYTYIFLVDKTDYNNHYYLISLLGFLLCLVSANRAYSIDAWRARRLRWPVPTTIPYWNLFILKFQLLIVYFYGGIAKINQDWLAGEPMRHWMQGRKEYPVVGEFFASEWGAYSFSYGGLAFDLSIGFLLWWRRTRLPAICAAVGFHLGNNWIFSIGIFPTLMIASTVLFLDPERTGRQVAALGERWLRRRRFRAPWHGGESPPRTHGRGKYRGAVLAIVSLYVVLQILLPLRHWLYRGNVAWTEQGHMFSWRMKLRSKRGVVALWAADPATGETWQVNLGEDLTYRQIRKMAGRPHMIIQYAHHTRDRLIARGIADPILRAETGVSLNYRRWQRMIDPDWNLAEARYSPWASAQWILPLNDR